MMTTTSRFFPILAMQNIAREVRAADCAGLAILRPLVSRSAQAGDVNFGRRFALTRRVLYLAAAATNLLGCSLALQPNETYIRQHAVFVGSAGEAKAALSREEGRSLGLKTDHALSAEAYRTYLDSLVASIRRAGTDTILLFIHGGRVSLRDGANNALDLAPKMERSGYYPVFVVWDGSDVTSLAGHYKYRQGVIASVFRVREFSYPFTFAEDLARGLVRAPFTLGYQILDYCRTLARIRSTEGRPSDASCRIAASDAEERRVLRQREDSLRTNGAIGMARVDGLVGARDSLQVSWGEYHASGWQTTRWFGEMLVGLVPRIATGALIDGFGTGAWDDMLRRTTVMFRPVSEATRLDAPPGARPPSGATGQLLTRLETMIDADAQQPDSAKRRHWSIILAGHSMGTIVANTILRLYPHLPVARILLLAPASSIHDIEASAIPFLRAHPDATMAIGTLHPFAETGERVHLPLLGALAPVIVPNASLLEWIDNYFEKSRTPLDRRAGKWRNSALSLDIYPTEIRSRILLKAFGFRDPLDSGTPLFTKPQTHGDFDSAELKFWMPEFWATRRKGATPP